MTKNNDVYVYEYHGGLYINPTNRCTNACIFCLRNDTDGVGNNPLWIEKEPTSDDVINQLKQFPHYNTVIFCGFGEPMYRLELMIDVCKYLKQNDVTIKVNTNGHANKIHGKNVLPALVGLVDAFSISLNADNKFDYQTQCQSEYGEEGFDIMLDFAKTAVELKFETVLSVVDHMPSDTIENCQKIAKDIGATLRIRHFVENN
jgi:TatD family-associated radical SAM protein